MQIAVGKIASRFDRAASVQAAAIQPIDLAGRLVRRRAFAARLVFQALGVLFDHPATDSGYVRVGVEEGQCWRQKAVQHLHVAVEDVDKLAA